MQSALKTYDDVKLSQMTPVHSAKIIDRLRPTTNKVVVAAFNSSI
jgi:hypothetical protein